MDGFQCAMSYLQICSMTGSKWNTVAIGELIFFAYLCNVLQDSILLSAKITWAVLKIVNMSKENKWKVDLPGISKTEENDGEWCKFLQDATA